MNNLNINGIVLDDVVAKQLSDLQDEYARVLSDGLGNFMDFILEECVPQFNGREKKLLEYIETIYATQKALMKLVPKKKEGEQ